jgi:hypothetical protein
MVSFNDVFFLFFSSRGEEEDGEDEDAREEWQV